MSYHLDNHIVNIAGPKGNAFELVCICANFVRQIEDQNAARQFVNQALGKTGEGEFRNALGAKWTYSDVVRFCKNRTGITLWSNTEIPGLDRELYTLSDQPPMGYIYT